MAILLQWNIDQMSGLCAQDFGFDFFDSSAPKVEQLKRAIACADETVHL